LAVALAGDTIVMMAGAYSEVALTIARAQSRLTILGFGAPGTVIITTSTTNGTALTNLANDVQILNVKLVGNGTGGGLTNYGQRFYGSDCRFDLGADGLIMTRGTVAQVAALTHGTGTDGLLEDCEFALSTATGIKLVASDDGAIVNLKVRRGRFHNLAAAAFEESGGVISARFRNLEISDCVFDDMSGGAPPTKYISLNDDNGNDGIVTRCSFPTALAGGLNLVSTALTWVANYHPAGLSTTQPS